MTEQQTVPQPPAPQKMGPSVWPGTIVGFILSILSIVFCLGILAGVPGLILGFMGSSKAKKEPQTYSGKGMATAAIIMGIIGIVINILLIIFTIWLSLQGESIIDYLNSL